MILEIGIEQQDEKGRQSRPIGKVILEGKIRYGKSMREIPYLEGIKLPFNESIDSQLWRVKTLPRRRMITIKIIKENSND